MVIILVSEKPIATFLDGLKHALSNGGSLEMFQADFLVEAH